MTLWLESYVEHGKHPVTNAHDDHLAREHCTINKEKFLPSLTKKEFKMPFLKSAHSFAQPKHEFAKQRGLFASFPRWRTSLTDRVK